VLALAADFRRLVLTFHRCGPADLLANGATHPTWWCVRVKHLEIRTLRPRHRGHQTRWTRRKAESRNGLAAAKTPPPEARQVPWTSEGCFGDPDWPGTTFWSTIGP
jgi:hypothetical protein